MILGLLWLEARRRRIRSSRQLADRCGHARAVDKDPPRVRRGSRFSEREVFAGPIFFEIRLAKNGSMRTKKLRRQCQDRPATTPTHWHSVPRARHLQTVQRSKSSPYRWRPRATARKR